MLARQALDDGANADVRQLKALALAKLNYVGEVFDICGRFRCPAFASIIDKDATGTDSEGLRKDYAYLFERFFYYLEDMGGYEQGVVVFDELEKSQSHVLIDQAHRYLGIRLSGKCARSKLFLNRSSCTVT